VKIAITGWSVLSPLGTTRERFAESIVAGRSGIAPLGKFDTSNYDSRLAAWLKEPIAYDRHIPRARLRRMDEFARQLVYVACEAFEQAAVGERAIAPERRAVVVASGINHTESIENFYASLLEEGPEGANPIYFPGTIPNSATGLIAIELECRGPNLTVTQKETSAETALILAADLLANDEADIVIVAAGETLTPVTFEGLSRLKALSRQGGGRTEQMKPFSRGTNGFIIGEGAAAVVVERGDRPKASQRPPFAYLAGWAECARPCSPVKYPDDPEPLARAVETMLGQKGAEPAEVAFASAAANSSPLDACEAETIARIARSLGLERNRLPVAAIKASIGEFCAGGLTRLLAAAASLRRGVCPPLPFDADEHNPEFDLLFSYRNRPVNVSGGEFIHLATATGGHQVALRVGVDDEG